MSALEHKQQKPPGERWKRLHQRVQFLIYGCIFFLPVWDCVQIRCITSIKTVMGDTPQAVHQSMISSLSGLVSPFSQLCTVRSPFWTRIAISL